MGDVLGVVGVHCNATGAAATPHAERAAFQPADSAVSMASISAASVNLVATY